MIPTRNLSEEKKIVKIVHTTFDLENFKLALCRDKPKEIYNIQYSDSKPLWIITEINDDYISAYATSWATKEPVKYKWDNFRRQLIISGIENVRY